MFYSVLVPQANAWLRQNQRAEVTKCQTLEKRITSPEQLSQSTPRCDVPGPGGVYYVKGLRYVPGPGIVYYDKGLMYVPAGPGGVYYVKGLMIIGFFPVPDFCLICGTLMSKLW